MRMCTTFDLLMFMYGCQATGARATFTVIFAPYRVSGFTCIRSEIKKKNEVVFVINGVKYSVFGVCVELNMSDALWRQETIETAKEES